MEDCRYDTVKIVYKLCRLSWFIEKHAKDDASKVGHEECLSNITELNNDLKKHIEIFKKLMCK